MQQSERYRVLANHFSYVKKNHLYAAKGETVKMVKWNADVCIVEGRERFAIRTEKLIKI